MRLIDADAFERHMMFQTSAEGVCDDCLQYVTDELKNYPTVDAAPVIRCKDCIHNDLDVSESLTVCRFDGTFHSPDFYCASGRRDDLVETEEIGGGTTNALG